MDKFIEFCVDVGKPGPSVSNGVAESISNQIKCYCRNQGFRFENSALYTPQKKEKLKEFWELLMLWLAVSWIIFVWPTNIGHML